MENGCDVGHFDEVHSSKICHNEETNIKFYNRKESIFFSTKYKLVFNHVKIKYPNEYIINFIGPCTALMEYYFDDIFLGCNF